MDLAADGMRNIYVNHELADADTKVYENFTVEIAEGNVQGESDIRGESDVREDVAAKAEPERMSYGGEGIADGTGEAADNENEIVTIVVLVNRQPVKLSGKSSYIYVDVFDQIDFDLSMQKGKSIITKLNGRPAQYMEPIHDGDAIEIYWQEN